MTANDPRSEWAEQMPEFGPDTEIYEADEARAAIAELLDGDPAADEQAVTRRLRGRPSLTRGAAKGHASKQIHVRIPDELSALVARHIATTAIKNESELVRTALGEYFERHATRP